MTVFHCDKLCSRPCCAWLRLWLDVATSRPELAILHINNCECPSCAATAASVDLAKLAELMVMGLRARGVLAEYPRICNHPKPSPMISLPYSKGTYAFGMRSSAFRTKLLAIMATPPNESSRKTCEQILRGDNGAPFAVDAWPNEDEQ